METVLAAHEQLERKGNLSKAIEDVQALIDLLQNTRNAVAAEPEKAPLHTAKLKAPTKQAFDKVEDDLKDVNKALNQYQKALKDKFKNASLSTSASGPLSGQSSLINRAIAMHLLREGNFDVANTFVREVHAGPVHVEETDAATTEAARNWMDDFISPDIIDANEDGKKPWEQGYLQRQFSDMYHILESLQNQHDLGPAIAWARQHSRALEARGSNLEFELSRLKFVELFTTSDDGMDGGMSGPLRALTYARQVFPTFSARYGRDISSLLGSLAFSPALSESPYKSFFYNQDSWEEVSASFTREFCGMLGLSERSPLYTAVTAGGIALPVLEKVERMMKQSRGQWTSVNELPVETPLPPNYLFHSIFVCPVSKDQATDSNPPMMIPCGHVIAKESLDMHSKGKQRMKCPYCPNESHPREAKRVYI